MNNPKNSGIVLFIVVTISIVAGFFVYPQGFGANILPWRLGLDLVGGSHLVYEVDMTEVSSADRDIVMNGLRDVIEKRVNLFGVSEPQVVTAKSGESHRLVVELAGITDTASAIQEIGETPFLLFSEVDPDPDNEEEVIFTPTDLTGRYVDSAQVGFSPHTNQPEVYLEFNEEGAEIFEEITGRSIGEPLAIFLDGNLVTAPTVHDRITGGRAQITGQFTIDEARQMVERFNAGALPAPITLISQQTVGATLGAQSLDRMVKAGFIGTILVIVFMIFYYRGRGFFASLALVMYVVLTLALFKLASATMTLAGIAGFVLSIGMAVDANILIFERMKEELKAGASRSSAVEDGFKRAWPAIRDSNVTTIITTVILYYFSSGFVRGFALTLMIGVITSMFSAITVTRSMLRTFIKDKLT